MVDELAVLIEGTRTGIVRAQNPLPHARVLPSALGCLRVGWLS